MDIIHPVKKRIMAIKREAFMYLLLMLLISQAHCYGETAPALPVHNDNNIALGTSVKSGDTSLLSLYFIPAYGSAADVLVTYDLLVPKSLTAVLKDGKKIRMTLQMRYFTRKAQSLKPIADAKPFDMQICGNAETGFYLSHGTDRIMAIEEDTFYRFAVRMSGKISVPESAGELVFCLDQKTSLTAKNVSGSIYIDNLSIDMGESGRIEYDFDKRYGKRGEQNLMVDNFFQKGDMGFTHGLYTYVSEIDSAVDSNFIRVNVVTDDTPASDNYDPNFSSMTLAFRNRQKFKVGDVFSVSYSVVIPKEMFRHCRPDGNVATSLVLSFDDEYADTTANCVIVTDAAGNITACKDGGQFFTVDSPKSAQSDIVIEEKDDCYLFRMNGTVVVPKSSVKKIWLKSMLSASGCEFDGYWYYNHFRIMNGEETVISYDVSTEPHPDTLVEFYTPTTNGIPYRPDDILYGFGHVGFERLNIQ